MESMLIPMMYYYKGSSNCYIRLEKDPVDETFRLISDYGEVIRINGSPVILSGHGLAEALIDLEENKYA